VCLCNIHNLTSSVRGNKDNDLFCGGMVVGLGRFARFFSMECSSRSFSSVRTR
jgi:hypothetical protein